MSATTGHHPSTAGLPDWRRTWAEAGIALAHPRDAWYRRPCGACPTLQAERPSLGGEASVGDLVVLHDDGPDAANQEVRRVSGVDPSPCGDRPALRLGPPLPRHEWPAVLLMRTPPLELPFRRTGAQVELIGQDGEPVVGADVRTEDGRAFLGLLHEVVRSAAAAGMRDGTLGEIRSYGIGRGLDREGRRAWLLGDDVDGPLAALPRGVLDRSPPGGAAALRRAAHAAYDAARGDVAARLARIPGIPVCETVEPGDEYLAPAP